MNNHTRTIGRLIPYVALVLLLLGVTPVFADDGPRPEELLATAKFDQQLDQTIPLDLQFRDETGKDVTLSSYFNGKPIILAMVYYNCPNICNIAVEDLIQKMNDVSYSMGKDFDVVTVSIDPGETPEMAAVKKAEYAKHYNRAGSVDGWHALTGDDAMIKRLARSVGFNYAWDPEMQQYAHPSGVIAISPQGKIAQYLYALVYSATDLRLSIVEASENRIGTLVDKILLRCYHFDPLTGQYTATVMTIVRIMGGILIAGLGGFLFWAMYQERRKSASLPTA